MNDRARLEPLQEPHLIVQRLFVRAAQRLDGAAALGGHLGLTYSELRRYLAGEAIAPPELLLRTVDLVVDDLDVIKAGFSEAAWRALWPSDYPLNKE